MTRTFCPFINGTCKAECMFRTNSTAIDCGIVTCALPVYLYVLKENQVEKADDIIEAVKNKK